MAEIEGNIDMLIMEIEYGWAQAEYAAREADARDMLARLDATLGLVDTVACPWAPNSLE